MTQTVQPCTWALLNEVEKALSIHKPRAQDSISPQIYDNLNELRESLNRLEDAIQKQIVDLDSLGYAIKTFISFKL
jgi:hypothetical protein